MNINKEKYPTVYKYCFLVTLAGTLGLVASCDSAKEDSYNEKVEQSSTYDTAESGDTIAYDVSNDTAAIAENKKLVVDNVGDSSNITLGSQATDVEIDGKELLVNASANFKVDDVVETRNTIETLTGQYKGYIASSRIESNEVSHQTFTQQDKDITLVTYYRQANMQVRIPKQKVSEFLNQVQKQVTFLNYQEFSAKDVTLDLYREKLQAQLNSQMASDLTEQRLDSDNEKEQASNVDSIKATYSAKQRQQMAELERMMIADQVKYSTIELSFTQPNSVYKETTESIDHMLATEQPGFWQQVKQSIIDGWEMIKFVILGIISLWWLWTLIAIAFIIFRVFRKLIRRVYTKKPKRAVKDESVNSND